VALIWILNPAVLQAILAVPAKNERVQNYVLVNRSGSAAFAPALSGSLRKIQQLWERVKK
jgi:hypothetical protein